MQVESSPGASRSPIYWVETPILYQLEGTSGKSCTAFQVDNPNLTRSVMLVELNHSQRDWLSECYGGQFITAAWTDQIGRVQSCCRLFADPWGGMLTRLFCQVRLSTVHASETSIEKTGVNALWWSPDSRGKGWICACENIRYPQQAMVSSYRSGRTDRRPLLEDFWPSGTGIHAPSLRPEETACVSRQIANLQSFNASIDWVTRSNFGEGQTQG